MKKVLCGGFLSLMFLVACASSQPKECVDGNCTDGTGTASYEGDRYVGSFKGTQRAGVGEYVWKKGDRYKGAWADGKRSGPGDYSFSEGDTYAGEYKDNVRNGKGTYVWKSGDRYVGDWKEGLMDGAEAAAGHAKIHGCLPEAVGAPPAQAPRKRGAKTAVDARLVGLEPLLTERAGVLVKTVGTADHGKLTFHFSSRRELEGLLERFNLQPAALGDEA